MLIISLLKLDLITVDSTIGINLFNSQLSSVYNGITINRCTACQRSLATNLPNLSIIFSRCTFSGCLGFSGALLSTSATSY